RVESRGAWWFPYTFDFALASGMNLRLHRPWYSAMAQGQATSLFIRLAQATGDNSWRIAADRSFAALRLGISAAGPWVTHRDVNGRLWLEEYPSAPPSGSGRVLNGHVFAMYGAWDLWSVTRSAAAAAVFADAAATVKRYIRSYRNAGWASSYALRGRSPTEKYHTIHVDQLLHLHAMTGDASFAAMAETLQADFPAPKQNAAVLLAAGQHTGVHFGSTKTGTVTDRRLIALRAPSVGTADLRRRIGGQPGYWYHLNAGSLRNYWVQEVAGVRATLAPVSTVNYLARRTVRLAAGTHTVCAARRCSVARLAAASNASIGSIGWIRGRRAVRVTSGQLRNWWLPLTSRTTVR
ncbi:D-glucuronyl C5-epimerase family protein, partial [Actinoplanes sp. NPDC051633]|uniref:D-glucuronyl C5-epimerase family protein n=1 Tax=Actinoplanes sp. NPDC051633 TaxID=3155670 RepID=UPI0034284B71